MGVSTHKLSSNKLRLLEIARDSLHSALQCLPLPFATSTFEKYQFPEGSPLEVCTSPATRDQTGQNRFSPQTPSMPPRGLPRTVSSYSVLAGWEDSGRVVIADPQPPPEEKMMKENSGFQKVSSRDRRSASVSPPASPRKDHKARLSQSLSTKHNLAHELVPSPLFSRARNYASVGIGADEATSRPLPALPFNHKTGFQILGTHIRQIPRTKMVAMRKTGIQTLIARFEGQLPLSGTTSPASFRTTDHQSSPYPSTPITPRFDMIHSAFEPHPAPSFALKDSPSCPLTSASASTRLAGVNALLSSFRNEVRIQLSDVTTLIQKTERLQLEHCREKTLCNSRLASFWSFEPALDSPQPKTAPSDGPPPAHPTLQSKSRILTRKKRIEMLRADQWRVSKEKHGFKGEAYYDELCARTTAELDQCLERYKSASSGGSGCTRDVVM